MLNSRWLLVYHKSGIAADCIFFFSASLHKWIDARNNNTHVSCASQFHVNIFFSCICRCSPQQLYIISLYFLYFNICIYYTKLSIETSPSNINFLFIFTRNLNRTNLFLSLHVWIYAIMWKSFFSLQIFQFLFRTSGLWIEIKTAIHAL